jgi:hypothetical protein
MKASLMHASTCEDCCYKLCALIRCLIACLSLSGNDLTSTLLSIVCTRIITIMQPLCTDIRAVLARWQSYTQWRVTKRLLVTAATTRTRLRTLQTMFRAWHSGLRPAVVLARSGSDTGVDTTSDPTKRTAAAAVAVPAVALVSTPNDRPARQSPTVVTAAAVQSQSPQRTTEQHAKQQQQQQHHQRSCTTAAAVPFAQQRAAADIEALRRWALAPRRTGLCRCLRLVAVAAQSCTRKRGLTAPRFKLWVASYAAELQARAAVEQRLLVDAFIARGVLRYTDCETVCASPLSVLATNTATARRGTVLNSTSSSAAPTPRQQQQTPRAARTLSSTVTPRDTSAAATPRTARPLSGGLSGALSGALSGGLSNGLSNGFVHPGAGKLYRAPRGLPAAATVSEVVVVTRIGEGVVGLQLVLSAGGRVLTNNNSSSSSSTGGGGFLGADGSAVGCKTHRYVFVYCVVYYTSVIARSSVVHLAKH